MHERRFQKRSLFLIAYLVFALLPIYWMVNMSFKTNEEILSVFSLWPRQFTLEHYKTILTDESWYSGYINSMIYVAINTVVSLLVALPAAYAFSRYRFLGDKHVFFWLLTNRMTPPAVFLLPFFQLYTTLGMMDTHIAVALAHLLFNVPLAVWILEGFMSGIPREIDETAYIDGYSFPRFFLTIFLPLIKAGVGVAAFFCFMFSWVELLMARTLTSVNAKPIVATMTRTVSASGMDWATLAAAGVQQPDGSLGAVWRQQELAGLAQHTQRAFGREAARLEQDPVRDAHLADVVQRRGLRELVDAALVQLGRRAGLPGQPGGQCAAVALESAKLPTVLVYRAVGLLDQHGDHMQHAVHIDTGHAPVQGRQSEPPRVLRRLLRLRMEPT